MLKWVPGYLALVGLSSPTPSLFFIELFNRSIKLLFVDVRVNTSLKRRIHRAFHILEEFPAANGLFLLCFLVEEVLRKIDLRL